MYEAMTSATIALLSRDRVGFLSLRVFFFVLKYLNVAESHKNTSEYVTENIDI